MHLHCSHPTALGILTAVQSAVVPFLIVAGARTAWKIA